jgi:hypothetical protein
LIRADAVFLPNVSGHRAMTSVDEPCAAAFGINGWHNGNAPRSHHRDERHIGSDIGSEETTPVAARASGLGRPVPR